MADAIPPRALDAYRRFHGRDPDEILVADVPDELGLPRYLVAIGKAEQVVYRPVTPSTKRNKAYKHTFGDFGERQTSERPWLLWHPDSDALIILPIDSHYTVNARGIVG